MRPEDVINLDSYPIADPGSPALTTLIARLSSELSDNQHCSLPGFMRPQALERAVADAVAARPQAHDNNARRNCYLHRESEPALPADHPRNIMNDTSTRMIAYDLLPDDSPLKALYHWAPTREFITAVVGEDKLYDNADPLQPVNVLCAEKGDQSAWHFDSSNAFTMTLMLQAPGDGGEFELVPNTRSQTDENYGYVQDVLTGNRAGDAVRVAREPGSLCLFRGCNSMHRVTRVESDPMRIMAVFVYELTPGVIGDPRVNANIYGPRAA